MNRDNTVANKSEVSDFQSNLKPKRLRQALDDTSDLCNTILVDDAVETFSRYCTTHIESFDDIPSQPAAAPPEGEPSAGDGGSEGAANEREYSLAANRRTAILKIHTDGTIEYNLNFGMGWEVAENIKVGDAVYEKLCEALAGVPVRIEFSYDTRPWDGKSGG